MTKMLKLKSEVVSHYLLLYGVPFSIIAFLVVFSNSQLFHSLPEVFSPAVVLDLIVTVPIITIFILHKKKISKIYAAPLFILGAFIAGNIIPIEHQGPLDIIKYTLIPIIELGIVYTVIRKVYKKILGLNTSKNVRSKNLDFYEGLKLSLGELFPRRIASLAINEIATIYFLIFGWSTYSLKEGEFSYHKTSGGALIASVLLGLVITETFVAHVLLAKWSTTFAWAMTILSAYTMLQIIGMLRGAGHRPIVVDQDMLYLRYSFINEVVVPIKDIIEIEETRRSLNDREDTIMLSVLGDLETHNLVIHLKHSHHLNRIYGIKSSFKSIGIFVDQKEAFLAELASRRSIIEK